MKHQFLKLPPERQQALVADVIETGRWLPKGEKEASSPTEALIQLFHQLPSGPAQESIIKGLQLAYKQWDYKITMAPGYFLSIEQTTDAIFRLCQVNDALALPELAEPACRLVFTLLTLPRQSNHLIVRVMQAAAKYTVPPNQISLWLNTLDNPLLATSAFQALLKTEGPSAALGRWLPRLWQHEFIGAYPIDAIQLTADYLAQLPNHKFALYRLREKLYADGILPDAARFVRKHPAAATWHQDLLTEPKTPPL